LNRPGGRIVVCLLAAVVLTGCADTGGSPRANEPTATREAAATSDPTPSTSSPSTPSISAGQGASGLEGTTVVDHCPVVTEAGCPTVPIATHVIVTDSAGTVAATDTGDDGRFRITLEPGDYTVVASARSAGITRPATANVTVVVGRFLAVTLQLDSGIR
jgi:hypothetical protein